MKNQSVKHASEFFLISNSIFMNSVNKVNHSLSNNKNKIKLGVSSYQKDVFKNLSKAICTTLYNQNDATRFADQNEIESNRIDLKNPEMAYTLEYIACVAREFNELSSQNTKAVSEFVRNNNYSVYLSRDGKDFCITLISPKNTQAVMKEVLKAKLVRKSLEDFNNKIYEKFETTTYRSDSLQGCFEDLNSKIVNNQLNLI